MIIIKDIDLTEEEKEYLDFVNSSEFPFFLQFGTENHLTFTHTMMRRNSLGLPVSGKINSSQYKFCIPIFERFCKETDIIVNNILRAAINVVGYEPFKNGDIHEDHNFPHKVFLMYLNEFDDGYTYLFDHDHNLKYAVVPKKNRAVVFDSVPHANGFCKPKQKRIVFVVTFN